MFPGPGRLVASALLGGFVLAGCQPAMPTPSPVPSWRCTPEAGGDEFDCSQRQYDEMVAKDKLYAEAEAVYRRFFAEDVRIMRAGGVATATPVLMETTTGAFLEDSMSYYRSLEAEQSKLVGGDVLLTFLERQPGITKGGSLVALKACIDASSARIEVGGKELGAGRLGSDTLYFIDVQGTLRIQGADGKEGDRCD